ncbi:DNA replication complex GINS protein PSF2 isoform X2 [Cervus elaphus]|uniref:DNA replication complex GINS protein PSF2 isoform X2 n=1 Tax=Cervus elaphus TaxID=9860 RepID=UPI001CC27967|nr:DNA replication complex GINS protein PSF2 isoform X2 [Cervus elaphus]
MKGPWAGSLSAPPSARGHFCRAGCCWPPLPSGASPGLQSCSWLSRCIAWLPLPPLTALQAFLSLLGLGSRCPLSLCIASDNIPKADEIRTLIKDVWDTRIAKFRVSADSFVRQQEAHAKLDNLTLMEINTSGAFLTQALNHMYKLRTNLQPSDSAQSQDF